jgi:hypothetical protein
MFYQEAYRLLYVLQKLLYCLIQSHEIDCWTWCRFLCVCSCIRSTEARTDGMSTWDRKWCDALHNRPPQVSASYHSRSHSYWPSLTEASQFEHFHTRATINSNILFVLFSDIWSPAPSEVVECCLWLGVWALRRHRWIARLIFAERGPSRKNDVHSVIDTNSLYSRNIFLGKSALKSLRV